MSVILLTDLAEKSTNDVINYWKSNNTSFVRITETSSDTLTIQNDKVRIGEAVTTISSFWVRKGQLHFEVEEAAKDLPKLSNYFQNEFVIFSDFIVKQLEQKPHIGNYFQRVPNKLWHLDMARKAGLIVPDMLVTTNKKEAQAFLQKHKSVINKFQLFGFAIPHHSVMDGWPLPFVIQL
jgi:glutathione synthase/RimK-type ligase-like ATP-grasp enzyme